MTIKIQELGSCQVRRVWIPKTLRPSRRVSHHSKSKNFSEDPFLSPGKPLAHGQPGPLPQHMACIQPHPPPPPHPHQRLFPTRQPPFTKFPPKPPPPSILSPSKSQSLSPKGARARASFAGRLWLGMRPWHWERPQREWAQLPRTERRVGGSPDCRRPETGPPGGGGSRVSRLTQQSGKGQSTAAIVASPLPTPFLRFRPGPAGRLSPASVPTLGSHLRRLSRPAAAETTTHAEVSGSRGSGCLFSGVSLPAPHAGLHTAPHTPLRTALLRLAHATNQRAELGCPIRASCRDDRPARARRGEARGGHLPRSLIFPAVTPAQP